MHIRTITDAETALQKYIPAVKELIGKDITLERMSALMTHIGNPQNDLQVIHVAGTSGKTSTSYYCAALLQHMGYSVGLTVSPHIDTVTERVQINGQPLSEKEFCLYLTEFLQLIDTAPLQPTYFELLMALAYWVFKKRGVDVAVIETGLGGLHDGSNVVTRTDKICVITDIGFDHMHILGKTLSSIAAQKAGIIQRSNVVCMYQQQHNIMKAVRERAKQKNADLQVVVETKISANDLPVYQQRNFALALYVVNVFLNRRHSVCTLQAITKARATYIPARMDNKMVGNKKIVFDGAHNQQKMHAFVTSMQQQYPAKKFVILLAMKQSKEYADVLTELKPICDMLILTQFNVTQDIPSVSEASIFIQQQAHKLGIKSSIIDDQKQAYSQLLVQTVEVGIVTGSFYLIAQLRHSGIAATN